jgi:hypothetical protein
MAEKNNKKSKLIIILYYWLPALIWGYIIFSFSSIQTHPVSVIHWQDFIVKKSAHLTEYGIFAVLVYRAFKGSSYSSLKSFYFALIVCLIYGISDEFHQMFTPGREPTLRDSLIDASGAFIVLLGIRDLLPKVNNKFKTIFIKLGINFE